MSLRCKDGLMKQSEETIRQWQFTHAPSLPHKQLTRQLLLMRKRKAAQHGPLFSKAQISVCDSGGANHPIRVPTTQIQPLDTQLGNTESACNRQACKRAARSRIPPANTSHPDTMYYCRKLDLEQRLRKNGRLRSACSLTHTQQWRGRVGPPQVSFSTSDASSLDMRYKNPITPYKMCYVSKTDRPSRKRDGRA